jgi:hypothetical protein
MESMVPILAGFIVGQLLLHGRADMNVANIIVEPPDSLVVNFGSGVSARVQVTEVPRPEGA